ncbi:MAG: hypothetical protein ACE5E6_10975 [Phycisphaerae bacterium]
MDLLNVRTLPFLTRRNYYYEFQHIVTWSILAGLIEGGQFASVVVSKSFGGSERLIAIATTTPVAALLCSLVWGMVCVGRAKLRVLTVLVAATALCAGAVFAIPGTRAGAVWFLVQMGAAQALIAGVVTVRSAVWRVNYPRSARGRIAARLQGARVITSVVTVLGAAVLCDRDPGAYRYIYPVAAACGIASVLFLPYIHIRGERAEIRRHRQPRFLGDVRTGLAEPFDQTAILPRGHVVRRIS